MILVALASGIQSEKSVFGRVGLDEINAYLAMASPIDGCD